MEERYGRLKIVKDMGIMTKEGTKSKRHYFLCRCDCGKEKLVSKTDLISGKVRSCGCYFKEKLIERNRKYNDYFLFNDIVFVKFSNVDRFFICDKEDLEIVKNIVGEKIDMDMLVLETKENLYLFIEQL